MNPPFAISQILIFIAALAIDLTVGDPPERLERYYPIVWISRLMYRFDRMTERGNPRKERFRGVSFSVLIATIFTVPCCAMFLLPWELYIIAAALIFKMTFTLNGLERYARNVITADDLDSKRNAVGKIVSRAVTDLDQEHLNSATIESVAENLTDSVIAPFFYFAIAGLPGAMLYRVINTLDAVVGYKTDRYIHFGWFAARADDVLNYVPERIAAGLILLVGGKTRIAKTGKRVHLTIVAMSSVLNVKLEKIGHYSVTGTGCKAPRTEHIRDAIRIAKRSAFVFAICYIMIMIMIAWLNL